MKRVKVIFKVLVALLVVGLLGCSEEGEIVGCTDASAENYNPEAAIDGSCTYLRDAFIGNYNIEVNNCSRNESFLEKLGAGIVPNIQSTNDVDLVITGVFSQSLIFKGEVANTSILFSNSMDDAFVSLPADALVYNNTLYMFPTFVLNGTIRQEGNILSGRLTLAASDADNNHVGIFSLICDYQLSKDN